MHPDLLDAIAHQRQAELIARARADRMAAQARAARRSRPGFAVRAAAALVSLVRSRREPAARYSAPADSRR